MKKTILSAAIAALITSPMAFAASNPSSAAGGNSNLANANDAVAASNILIDSHDNNGVKNPKLPVYTAIAPSISVNWDCEGKSLAMAGQTSILGLSFGKTGEREHCIRMKYATLVYNMGDAGPAKALLCQDPSVRKAYETAGTSCGFQMDMQGVSNEIRYEEVMGSNSGYSFPEYN